jgi:hypothetical protein
MTEEIWTILNRCRADVPNILVNEKPHNIPQSNKTKQRAYKVKSFEDENFSECVDIFCGPNGRTFDLDACVDEYRTSDIAHKLDQKLYQSRVNDCLAEYKKLRNLRNKTRW